MSMLIIELDRAMDFPCQEFFFDVKPDHRRELLAGTVGGRIAMPRNPARRDPEFLTYLHEIGRERADLAQVASGQARAATMKVGAVDIGSHSRNDLGQLRKRTFGQCDLTNNPGSNCYQQQGPPYRN
jgi:hypothetical protein